MLEKYINIFEHRNKQFFTKQQILEFYMTYTEMIFKHKILFADKIKRQDLQKTIRYTKKNLNVLAKLFHNQKALYQIFKNRREVAPKVIENK